MLNNKVFDHGYITRLTIAFISILLIAGTPVGATTTDGSTIVTPTGGSGVPDRGYATLDKTADSNGIAHDALPEVHDGNKSSTYNQSKGTTGDVDGPEANKTVNKSDLPYKQQIKYNPHLTERNDSWGPPASSTVNNVTQSEVNPNGTRVVVGYNPKTGEVTRTELNTSGTSVNSAGEQQSSTLGGVNLTATPRKVIGGDDRDRITSTTSFPWSTVVELRITAANGKTFTCSGSIVAEEDVSKGSFHVLTAGHCVYLHDNGGWVRSITVVPGANGSEQPWNVAEMTYMRTYDGWTDSKNINFDFAMLTLDRSIGEYTGSMGYLFRSESNSIYSSSVTNVAGYPFDKPDHTMWHDADAGLGTIGQPFVTDKKHKYEMDTEGGMSGGPVWVHDYFGKDSNYQLTVHAYAGALGNNHNFGTRITENKFNDVQRWMSDDYSDRPPNDKPDFVDDGSEWASFTPEQVRQGDSFSIENDIRNIGTSNIASSECVNIEYYASKNDFISESDYYIGSDQICSLSPFTYADVGWSGPFPSSVPAGDYYLGWIIDPNNRIKEFNESNNRAVLTSDRLVVNSLPDASFNLSPMHPNQSEQVTFDASVSSDNGFISSYEWDFNGDGTTDATGRTVSRDFLTDTSVELTVTDNDGATDSVTKTVDINQYPTVKFNRSPSNPAIGESVSFDASLSSDPDGSISSYKWDFDTDGNTDATGQTVSYAFSSTGTKSVELTVIDDDGATISTTRTLRVVKNNAAPTADFDYSPSHPNAGESITFDASLSGDPDGSISSYKWDLDGDGTTDATGRTVSRDFSTDTSVELTVTDDDGATNSVTKTVDINQYPTAEFDHLPSNPAIGESVSFDASLSSDPDGSISSYKWDFDTDGNTDATGQTVNHTFNSAENKSVSLTVIDDNGASNVTIKTFSVVAGNARPTADAGGNRTVAGKTNITLDATGSTDPDGDSLNYQWTQTDGIPVSLTDSATATPEIITPLVNSTTTLTFEVTVSDGNLTDRDEVTVIVSPPPKNNSVTVQLQPETQTAAPGERLTYSVVVTNVTNNVSTFNVTVSLGNASVGEITNTTLTRAPFLSDVSIGPNGSQVTARGVYSQPLTTTTGRVELATVRLNGSTPGTTPVSVSVPELADGDGDRYPTTTEGATATVEPRVADLEATSLSAPSSVAYGETVIFVANVTNRGTIAGTKTVAFTGDVDGDGTPETVGQQTVSVNASETKSVQVAFQFDTAQGTGHVGSGFNSSSLVGEAVTLSVGVGGETATQTQSVNVSVSVTAPPAVGGSGTATDPDGDGIYEDVDGNGRESLSDVFDLFQQLGQAKQAPGAFDLNGDGEVTVVDVQLLFFEI